MADTDIAQEWRRLQSLYAGMSEEELQSVADEGYELTDVAKQVLNAEISKRGLQVIVRLAPVLEETQEGDEDFDPANLELTSACVVDNKEQAAWVKKTLNDAGIPCYFGPNLVEDVGRLQFPENRGVQVKVLAGDRHRVPFVLREFHAQFPSDDADEESADAGVACPKCHSCEIVFEGLDSDTPEEEPSDALDEEASAPEEAACPPKFHWSCDACGYRWEDDGVESKT